MTDNKHFKGNKGEWSEVYVLFKLLADGILRSAVKVAEKTSAECKINEVIRSDSQKRQLRYHRHDNKIVDIFIDNELSSQIDVSCFSDEALQLYKDIVNSSGKSVTVKSAEKFLGIIKLDCLKAPSSDKSDITIDFHDNLAAGDVRCGFSIKSELGGAPTLLNASGATKFRFRIQGIDDSTAEILNAPDEEDLLKYKNLKKSKKYSSPKKILNRLLTRQAENKSSIIPEGCINTVFKDNLCFICDHFELILSSALLIYYGNNGKSRLTEIVNELKQQNPLNYSDKQLELYAYKFKRFLSSIALGMQPASPWNGYDEANGGYLIVAKNGDVLAYHIYHRNAFEDKLFNETKFDTPASRNNFGYIRKDEKGFFIDLALQIRFF